MESTNESKKVATEKISQATDKIREMLDAKRQKSQKELKNQLLDGKLSGNQQEIVKPLSSYYSIVGDDHFSQKNYMKKRRQNAMEFQKVKSEK